MMKHQLCMNTIPNCQIIRHHAVQYGAKTTGCTAVHCYNNLHNRQMNETLSTVVSLQAWGKSLFSFYFMWLLAKQEQTVLWERRHAAYARVMFSPQGVFSGNAESFNDELQKSTTW